MRAYAKREHQSKDAKELKCKLCDRTFVTNTNLRRQARETHGENSGLFFPVRHSLERHVRHVRHPVKQPCPKCAAMVIYLETHLITVHQLSPADSRAREGHGKISRQNKSTIQPRQKWWQSLKFWTPPGHAQTFSERCDRDIAAKTRSKSLKYRTSTVTVFNAKFQRTRNSQSWNQGGTEVMMIVGQL